MNQEFSEAIYKEGCDCAGVPGELQNWGMAAFLWELAAFMGNREAMMKLRSVYIHGLGVEENMGKSLYWCTKAAELGDPAALCCLALRSMGKGDSKLYNYWVNEMHKRGIPFWLAPRGWLKGRDGSIKIIM